MHLREDCRRWMKDNTDTRINGSPLSKWLSWESGYDSNGWGGATDMVALSRIYPLLSFEVYRHRSGDLYDLITRIGDGSKRVLLCWSGSHYDALESP